MTRRSTRPKPRAATCAAASALDHLDWAAGIAGKVARDFRLRGAEREDLVGVAHLAVCELLAKPVGRNGFDPSVMPAGGSLPEFFRGWAYLSVRCACVREAERLRGGGTFRTKRPGRVIVAAPLGDSGEWVDDCRDQPEPRDLAPADLDLPPPAVVYGRRLAGGSR